MSKKQKISAIDFDFGIGDIIPSTQEAFHVGEYGGTVRKTEKESLAVFKNTVVTELDIPLANNEQFPSNGEVFVFIVQYFVSENEYSRRDIDNMAKTILEILKGRFYRDDSQLKTLQIGKKMQNRVPQNFAYVAIKKLSANQDIDALKISGLERSVTLFQEAREKLKSQKVI